MKIQILMAAPLKEPGTKSSIDDYLRRAQSRFPASFLSIKGEKIPPRTAPDKALQKEAKRLLEKVPTHHVIVAMCAEGKTMSSQRFSQWMSEQADLGRNGITFIIGSAYGLHQDLVQKADLRLSLSPMTLPHQHAALILSEQIYRATAILSGAPYHK
jgi:23S rRNA (pseudouridine1915-N3)-methyltransferase